MRIRLWAILPIALAVAVACAKLPLGKAYQSAGVLIVANQQVRAECTRSKEAGIAKSAEVADPVLKKQIREKGLPPFTKATCAKLSAGYKIAKEAAKKALEFTSAGKVSPPQLAAAGIQYIYTVTQTLAKAGVKPASALQEFIDELNRLLLKPTEVN